METKNDTLYKELVKVQNRCDECCESCSDYDKEDGTCKWEEAIGHLASSV